MAKLFLSYSRKDEARARRFTDWLEHDGHDVWRDEDDIGGGASFSSEIEKALEKSDAVLVLWSADSVQSAWVRDEASYGRAADKLIPLLLDGTNPPLGFRQYQSIDLSKWKGRGDPSAAERIRSAIARLAEDPGPNRAGRDGNHEKSLPAIPRALLATALLVLAGLALLSAFLWGRAGEQGITIVVSASPNSPDRATAADYANVTAADMAAFLPTRFDGAKVIGPGHADKGARGYHIDVAVNRRGQAADASLTLSDRDGRSILWSKSWSVRDISGVDLRQEVSRFASRAALCLTDAQGGSEHLTRPALDVYVSGCVGMIDSSGAWSPAQLSSSFERVVALAPDFPPGWAYVAILRSWNASEENSSEAAHSVAVSKAREAIATARKLNPHSGLAYLAESTLQDDRVDSLALLDKGVDVEPTNAFVQSGRSEALGAVGRMAESVQVAKRAVELDPLSPFTRSTYILALTYAGQFSRAQADIVDARKKWPNDSDIEWAAFGFYYRYGDPHVAQQLMPRVLDYSDAQLGPYRKLLAARLEPSATNVKAAIDALRAQGRKDPDAQAKQLLALGLFGKFDEAYQLLSDPGSARSVDPQILFRPEFAPVRADPRFMGVASRAGLVRYWRKSGNWPDFCSSEQLKYDCKTEAAKYGN